jgi:hypothetical protein
MSSRDFGLWRSNVIYAARTASDREYQQRMWFGDGPEINSPDELFCTFFDDLQLEQFVALEELSPHERTAASRLLQALQAYAERSPRHLEPAQVIDDPHFENVRNAAREFLRIVQGGSNHPNC